MSEDTEGHEADAEPGHPFFPHHVIDQLVILYLLIGVVVALAVLLPFGLHEKADPLRTPIGIKPEWYFLTTYQLVKYLVPEAIAFAVMGLAAAALVLWPFIDAAIERRAPGRRLHIKIGAIALAITIGLALLGYVSERHVTVLGQKYHINLMGWPEREGTAGDVENQDGSP